MPKRAYPIQCSEVDRLKVRELSKSRTAETRIVERARMITGLLEGRRVKDVAAKLGVRPNTVIYWRKQFERTGVKGLYDRPRSGKPPRYTKEFRNTLLSTLEQPPPHGLSGWDGPALAQRLEASVHAVWRVLRKEGICLQRQRSWCVSTDPEFAPKAADIIGLYLNPPENALVLSIDEKPSMQALERKTGYVLTDSGKIVRGFKSTYKRHGTLNLFGALNVATGAIQTSSTERKRRIEFLQFMDELVGELPADKQVHAILDNYCIHKRCDTWLALHPNVTFHFTPTSASWLNQVEIWFAIMSRKVLRGASFKTTTELRQAIEEFIKAYNPTAKPFIWKKRDVKGSQLRNTIVNLCN
jgi:transposase